MKKRMSLVLMALLSLVTMTLTGCNDIEDVSESEYTVYYTNPEKTKLIAKNVELSLDSDEELAKKLISEMENSDKIDGLTAIKPESVAINDITLNNNIVSIYFTDEYYSMKKSTEVLYRGAVVKMMTQLESVDYVIFYVGEIPLTADDGTQIGLMSEEDFVHASDDKDNNIVWSNLTLYFANPKGNMLVKDEVSVANNKGVAIERVIVEQLISGPNITTCSKTLPESMKLLSISVSDRVCYVNLSSEFLTELVNVSDMISIYSIVNSLCELSNIDKVQFLINGDSKKTFRESISLAEPFEPNEDIVYTK